MFLSCVYGFTCDRLVLPQNIQSKTRHDVIGRAALLGRIYFIDLKHHKDGTTVYRTVQLAACPQQSTEHANCKYVAIRRDRTKDFQDRQIFAISNRYEESSL